jgi:hypothetical protein
MKLLGELLETQVPGLFFETINAGVLQVPLVAFGMMIMEFQFMQNIKPLKRIFQKF